MVAKFSALLAPCPMGKSRPLAVQPADDGMRGCSTDDQSVNESSVRLIRTRATNDGDASSDEGRRRGLQDDESGSMLRRSL